MLRLQNLRRSTNQPQSACRGADLTHLANLAHGSLVFAMVLGAIVGTSNRWATSVDGCVACSADFKIGELIEIDLNAIRRVPLGDGLDTFRRLLHLRVVSPVKQGIGEVQSGVELLVLVGKVHGRRERKGLVSALELGNCEVGRQLKSPLLVIVRETRDVGGTLGECTALKLNSHSKSVLSSGVDCLLSLNNMSAWLYQWFQYETYLS